MAAWKQSPPHFSPYTPPPPPADGSAAAPLITPIVSPGKAKAAGTAASTGAKGRRRSIGKVDEHTLPSRLQAFLKPKAAAEVKPVVDPVLTASKFAPSFVTAAAWNPTTHELFTGDFAGQICKWDLSELAATMTSIYSTGTHHKPASRTPPEHNDLVLPGVPADVADFMCKGRYAEISSLIMSVLLSGPQLVKLGWCLFGHRDNIVSLQYVPSATCSPYLLSAALDGCVYAWLADGTHIGTLCHDVYANRNPAWDIVYDVAALQASDEAQVAALVADFRCADFIPLHGEEFFSGDAGNAPGEPVHPDKLRLLLEGRWQGSGDILPGKEGKQAAAAAAARDRRSSARRGSSLTAGQDDDDDFGAALLKLAKMSVRRQAEASAAAAAAAGATGGVGSDGACHYAWLM